MGELRSRTDHAGSNLNPFGIIRILCHNIAKATEHPYAHETHPNKKADRPHKGPAGSGLQRKEGDGYDVTASRLPSGMGANSNRTPWSPGYGV